MRIFNIIAIKIIRFYKVAVSPYTPPSCRFDPTCSEYAFQAFQKYPFFKAFYLSTRRILRCHPFSAGGHDPLP